MGGFPKLCDPSCFGDPEEREACGGRGTLTKQNKSKTFEVGCGFVSCKHAKTVHPTPPHPLPPPTHPPFPPQPPSPWRLPHTSSCCGRRVALLNISSPGRRSFLVERTNLGAGLGVHYRAKLLRNAAGHRPRAYTSCQKEQRTLTSALGACWRSLAKVSVDFCSPPVAQLRLVQSARVWE